MFLLFIRFFHAPGMSISLSNENKKEVRFMLEGFATMYQAWQAAPVGIGKVVIGAVAVLWMALTTVTVGNCLAGIRRK